MILMKVKDVMTKNVAYVNPAATISETAQLMQQHNVGSIPVCDQSGVVGIVTDRDIVVRSIAHGKNPQQTKVTDIMTTGITTVSPDMEMSDVASKMSSSQIRRVPVVENNSLVGIVALGDVAVDAKFNTEVADTLSNISKPSKPQ
jgi:CBS domain-containing protein